MQFHKQLCLISLVFLLPGCASIGDNSGTKATQNNLERQIGYTGSALNLAIPSDSKHENQAYLDFYDLLAGDLRQEIEYFNGVTTIDQYRVSSHVFVPPKPIGTVFILHGYFDHVGTLSHMINAALKNDYAVFAYDLPGHGNSAGSRGDISSFTDNALLLNKVAAKYGNSLPKPYQLIGFSTGGSIALENAMLEDSSLFKKTVLVSPLIHHTQWRWGKFGYTIASPFINTLKSRDKANSNNIEYLEFAKTDPLRNTVISFKFLKALYQWNKRFHKSSAFETNMLVVQGELDNVVDWEYNLLLLRQKANNLKIHKVPHGKHQLFNEVESVRSEVFERILEFLDTELLSEGA